MRFVYALVTDGSASSMGRPARDPVVCCKLQLSMVFEGMRSERHQLALVTRNLA